MLGVAAGFLSNNLVKFSSELGAGRSSEQMILRAALILPSSSLAETAAASEAVGSDFILGLSRGKE